MPRVFVTTDGHNPPQGATVLLNEQVASVHLSTGHAASQLIERLAWAISDAEDAQGAAGTRAHSGRVVAALVPAPRAAVARDGARGAAQRPLERAARARRRQGVDARRSSPAAA
ncbi:MAG TPA: hypothetical protein VGD00_07530 [Solirubrobacteraceae bacterium]|jgi:hypothetical protein